MELKLDYPLLSKLVANELRREPVVPQWLSPAQVAVYVGLPEKTLAEYRRKSTGPTFSRCGKHVRYFRPDVDEWLRSLQHV